MQLNMTQTFPSEKDVKQLPSLDFSSDHLLGYTTVTMRTDGTCMQTHLSEWQCTNPDCAQQNTHGNSCESCAELNPNYWKLHETWNIQISNAKERDANGLYTRKNPRTTAEWKYFFKTMIPIKRRYWEQRLMLNPTYKDSNQEEQKMTLERWTASFAGHCYYINPNNYVISYNRLKKTWSILCPHKSTENDDKLGHAIYRAKGCSEDIVPPIDGKFWGKHRNGDYANMRREEKSKAKKNNRHKRSESKTTVEEEILLTLKYVKPTIAAKKQHE